MQAGGQSAISTPVPFAVAEASEALLPLHMWGQFKRAQLGLQATLDLANILIVMDAAHAKYSPLSSRRSSESSRRSSGQGSSPVPVLSAFPRSLSQRSSWTEAAQCLLKPATTFLQNFGGCPLPRLSAQPGRAASNGSLQEDLALLEQVRLSRHAVNAIATLCLNLSRLQNRHLSNHICKICQ